VEPLDFRLERRSRLLELRRGCDLGERARLVREAGVEIGERLARSLIDEERGDVVRELVARRSLDGPVPQRLAALEDLLDPDPFDAGLAEPFEVAGASPST